MLGSRFLRIHPAYVERENIPVPNLPLKPLAALLLALLASACAHLPVDSGRDAVARQLTDAGLPGELPPASPVADIPAAIADRLDAPLGESDAVEIALAGSPRVRAELARVDIAAADWLSARRPRNPGIEWSRLGEEYALGLHLALDDLLALPLRRGVAEAQWRADLAGIAATLAGEAAKVRRAYWDYAAAEQVAAMREAAAEAAALSAEMARRIHAAGNASALQLAREEAEAVTAAHAAARARADRLEARMRLAEYLGLAGVTNRWRVPSQLPLPDGALPPVDDLLARALSDRPDLAAARHRLAAAEQGRRLAGASALLAGLEVGGEREREGSERRSGVAAGIALPIFHQGQAAKGRARARQQRAAHALDAQQQAVQREVRTLANRLDVQLEIVRSHREALLPRRATIVAREQERYNFMLVGVFELLDARRREFDAWEDYYRAIARAWSLRADLEEAIGGPLPLASAAAAPAAQTIIAPSPGHGPHAHDHATHSSGDRP